jgi:hypothetical protein
VKKAIVQHRSRPRKPVKELKRVEVKLGMHDLLCR